MKANKNVSKKKNNKFNVKCIVPNLKKWNPLLQGTNLNKFAWQKCQSIQMYDRFDTDVVLCIALEGTWVHKLQ